MPIHRNNNPKLKFPIQIFILLLLAVVINITISNLREFAIIKDMINTDDIDTEEFRMIDIESKVLDQIKEKSGNDKEKYIELITVNMVFNNYHMVEGDYELFLNPKEINGIKYLYNSTLYQDLYARYEAIFNDLVNFPVPEDTKGETVVFADSWNADRSYGGKRKHEGTDIMSSNNIRGYFPIVSMTDGVIEKIGWLEKGGYRIGVRSPSGAYFYYAHLYDYAPDLAEGDKVYAGDILGFMGDSGYGEEGTIGQFDVHLHMGIYLEEESGEMSLNPYWILKYLEKSKLVFEF